MAREKFAVRLSHKIAVVGSIGVIGLLAVAATYITNERISRTERAIASATGAHAFVAMELDAALLDARRAEKDFLLRKETKYAERHGGVMKDIDGKLQHLLAQAPNYGAGIRDVQAVIAQYATAFDRAVEAHTKLGLTENAGLEQELRTAVRSLEALVTKIDRVDLANKVLMMRRHEKDYMLRHDDRYIGELEKRVAEFRALVEQNLTEPALRQQALQLVTVYNGAFKRWTETFKSATEALKAASSLFAVAEPKIDAVVNALKTDMTRAEDLARKTDDMTRLLITAVILVAGCLAGIVSLVIGRSISSSIRGIVASMAALARGELQGQVENTGRGDEIGEMARALAVFQANARERSRLEDEAEAKRQAELLRQTHIEKLVREFRTTMERVTKSLGGHTQGLHRTAEALGTAAAETNANAKTAGEAATSAAGSAATVAAAAEELSASITEISTQAQRASIIVAETAEAAAKTNHDIVQLDSMSERVGNIVDLINQIASQTNLLALNATIEAARAGEAGRGFAVVASEVKNLATKTADATKEIADLVTGVRASTATAVESLRLITGRIDEVNGLAAAIAAAVEEQNAATMEIARSVTSAAENTQKAVHGSDQVQGAAGVTSTQAREVLDVAKSVQGAAEDITSNVVIFLDAVNTDVEERRRALRHNVRRTAKVSIGGTKHTVTIQNISLSGARFTAPTIGAAKRQAVTVDLGSNSIPARVIWSNSAEMGIEFEIPLQQAHVDEIRAVSQDLMSAA